MGSDEITFDISDKWYCSDCDYIIGVVGYSNSTFTLMASNTAESIIKIVQNRPQVASISVPSRMLYFSTVIPSSDTDITVTLTALDSGSADLYIQRYNYTQFTSAGGGDNPSDRLPDPAVRATYTYTTAGTADDHVYIRGPHPQATILVVGVKALGGPVRFSIVATSAQSSVLLLSGVPQNHYVQEGHNEFFKFYPHTDADLHITVTGTAASFLNYFIRNYILLFLNRFLCVLFLMNNL
jgi:hypothetical protein